MWRKPHCIPYFGHSKKPWNIHSLPPLHPVVYIYSRSIRSLKARSIWQDSQRKAYSRSLTSCLNLLSDLGLQEPKDPVLLSDFLSSNSSTPLSLALWWTPYLNITFIYGVPSRYPALWQILQGYSKMYMKCFFFKEILSERTSSTYMKWGMCKECLAMSENEWFKKKEGSDYKCTVIC